MTFEPNYEKVNSAFRKNLGTTQAIVECKLPSEVEGKIANVLSANANAIVANSEIVGKEVTFVGYVGFQVIYLTDGGETASLDYVAEFRDRFTLLEEQQNVTPQLKCEVVDIQNEVMDESIKMTAIVEISVDGIQTMSVNALTSVTGENTFAKNETINYFTYNNVASEKFELNEKIEIKDSVDKILTVSPVVSLESVVAQKSYIKVKGELCIDIMYLTDGEVSVPRSMRFACDFEETVAGNNLFENSVIQSDIFVWLSDIRVITSLDVDCATVDIVVPVMFRGHVFNPMELDVVTDVFNANNNLLTNHESVNTLLSAPSVSYTYKITGNATVDDTMPFMDEVLGNVSGGVVVVSERIVDGRLEVEGVANTTVLYFSKETSVPVSYIVDIPFSIMLGDDIAENLTPVVLASLCDIAVKGKRGKEIEVTAALNVFADFYATNMEVVISNVTVQSEKESSELVLCIYIVKNNDTIWDVAKELSVSPDMILEQNPDLELPLTEGDRIIIYKQKEAQF